MRGIHLKRLLKTDDLLKFKNPGGTKISPDGKYIIYTVQELDKEQDKSLTNIFLQEKDRIKPRQLTFSGKDSAPSFSPDGRRIAFTSSRSEKNQIWIISLDGGEAWTLKTKEAVIGPLIWTPDGKSIIYSAEVFSHEDKEWTPYPGAPEYDSKRLKELADKAHADKPKDDEEKEKKANKVNVVTRFSYRFDGHGYFGQVRSQIFITPVPDEPADSEWKPQGRQITKGDFDHKGPSLSPDGKCIVVSSRHTEEADHEQKSDLWMFEIESGKAHLLYDAPGPASGPDWSPCGRYITFAGHDLNEGASTSNDLWILEVSSFMNEWKTTGESTPLTEEKAKNITRELDRPVGANKGWQHDKLVFILMSKGAGQIYEVSPADFSPKPLISDENRSLTTLAVGGDYLVYGASDLMKPQELYLHNGEEQQLTTVNEKIMNELQIGEWEKIVYESNDKAEIDGWIMYPEGFDKGKKYPLVLLIHGGPHAAYGPKFMFDAQLFTAQGYVVVFTNPRGSETYGQKFSSSIDKNWGDLDYKDVMAGVDTVIAKGFIDTENIFAHGWSYGGYMSCWISTQTDRFKAICAGASVTNMLSGYGTSDITLADEYEYGGTPWKDYAHLVEHSAIGHVDKVTSPVMLMHGENDLRVAMSQTEEFYVALKRLGKEAIMIRYPGEFHGLARPVHQLDRFERLVSWFNYYRDKK